MSNEDRPSRSDVGDAPRPEDHAPAHSVTPSSARTDERCAGRYPVPGPRDEPFDVTYRCPQLAGHDGPHGPTRVHYGTHHGAECGADRPFRFSTWPDDVTCPTCRGLLPIVAPNRTDDLRTLSLRDVVEARDRWHRRCNELLDALLKLTNEASGFLAMADPDTHGHTNRAVLRDRIRLAQDAIAKAEGVGR